MKMKLLAACAALGIIAAPVAFYTMKTTAAQAFTLGKGFEAYKSDSFAAALKGTQPVLVHVHADWCPTCRAQQKAFINLSADKEFASLKAIQVNFDTEKDFNKTYKIASQSTILLFKGGKEIMRLGGETSADAIQVAISDALKKN